MKSKNASKGEPETETFACTTHLGRLFPTALFARASLPNPEAGSWTPVCRSGRFHENGHPGQRADWAKRNPWLLLRFERVFLLRLAERRFLGLLFQEPPRITRWLRTGLLPW